MVIPVINSYTRIRSLTHEYAEYCLEKYSQIINLGLSLKDDDVKKCTDLMKELDPKHSFAVFQVIDLKLLTMEDRWGSRISQPILDETEHYGWDNEVKERFPEIAYMIEFIRDELYESNFQGSEIHDEFLGYFRDNMFYHSKLNFYYKTCQSILSKFMTSDSDYFNHYLYTDELNKLVKVLKQQFLKITNQGEVGGWGVSIDCIKRDVIHCTFGYLKTLQRSEDDLAVLDKKLYFYNKMLQYV